MYVPLVEFIYLVFTHMSGERYCRCLRLVCVMYFKCSWTPLWIQWIHYDFGWLKWHCSGWWITWLGPQYGSDELYTGRCSLSPEFSLCVREREREQWTGLLIEYAWVHAVFQWWCNKQMHEYFYFCCCLHVWLWDIAIDITQFTVLVIVSLLLLFPFVAAVSF